MKNVDFQKDEPLIGQCKTILLDRFIRSGSDEKKLPPERALAAEYGLSRMVVQRAIRELTRDGYFFRRPRQGTFVTKGRKTIRVLFYDLLAYSTKGLIRMFNETHSEISVEPVEVGNPAEYPGMARRALENGEIDLIKLSESLFRNFDDNRYFLPLNRHLDDRSIANLPSRVWDGFKRGKARLAVPIAYSPVIMLYNRGLFRRANVAYPSTGWTWETFFDIAKKLTDADASGKNEARYGFFCPFTTNQWPVFVLQNNGRVKMTADGGFNLTDAKVRETLIFLRDLIHKWRVAPLARDSELSGLELFAREKIAMTLSTYYAFPFLREKGPLDWDIAPLPKGKREATAILADAFAVAAGTKNLDACLKFLRFLHSPPAGNYIASRRSLVPVSGDGTVVSSGDWPAPLSYAIHEKELRHGEFLRVAYNTLPVQILRQEMAYFWYGVQDYDKTMGLINEKCRAARAISQTKNDASNGIFF